MLQNGVVKSAIGANFAEFRIIPLYGVSITGVVLSEIKLFLTILLSKTTISTISKI